MYDTLQSCRSQKEAGDQFDFLWAVYTVIPHNGALPKYLQAGKTKSKASDLLTALKEAKENGDTVIAAWVGQYKTDMFLIDDIDAVINAVSRTLNKQ